MKPVPPVTSTFTQSWPVVSAQQLREEPPRRPKGAAWRRQRSGRRGWASFLPRWLCLKA
jgi:hypothetical protein